MTAAEGTDHEEVVRFHDRATGLTGFVAIHSTALGPALGGTRFHVYASEDEGMADALRLARAMSYKNAVAGLAHGGGKAVIVGDPARDKTPDLLRAYGRFIDSLGGRYVTAADVGTTVADMDVIDETCRFVTGRSPQRGGAGDSAILTAYGLFQAMRAAVQVRWGDDATLAGRRVGVCGVGKVGSQLVDHLLDDGAVPIVTDVNPAAVARVRADHPEVEVVDDAATLVRQPMDVYAPCALGGALDDATVAALTAAVVCGAANNQLVHDGTAEALAEREILYCPDFVVNAGGVIQVADELVGFDMDRARATVARIFDTTRTVLTDAALAGVLPAQAADRLAEARMAAGPWARQLFPGLTPGRPPSPRSEVVGHAG
jgi:valine dehydrogenase (NAD+)